MIKRRYFLAHGVGAAALLAPLTNERNLCELPETLTADDNFTPMLTGNSRVEILCRFRSVLAIPAAEELHADV